MKEYNGDQSLNPKKDKTIQVISSYMQNLDRQTNGFGLVEGKLVW